MTDRARPRPLLLAPGVLLLAAGGGLLAGRGYMTVKGIVAHRLIDRALDAHLADGGAHVPWSWADMRPIASLEAARLRVRATILSGATGSSLAFDPGHVDGTAWPNRPGHCVLAGHRDREFRFLRDLRRGDILVLRTYGQTRTYRVDTLEVVARTEGSVLLPTGDDRLTLMTCYPFGGLLRSPWRYVVTARALPA